MIIKSGISSIFFSMIVLLHAPFPFDGLLPVPSHLNLDLVLDKMGVQLEVLLEVTQRPGFLL